MSEAAETDSNGLVRPSSKILVLKYKILQENFLVESYGIIKSVNRGNFFQALFLVSVFFV